MIEIPLDVFEVFETNTQADEIGTHACGALLFLIELTVRGGGWVNCETARIAHVGKMAEELQAFDELLARFCAAFDSKAEDRANALG